MLKSLLWHDYYTDINPIWTVPKRLTTKHVSILLHPANPLYICMCIHTYVYIYTYTYTYTYTYVCIYIYTYLHIYIHIYIYNHHILLFSLQRTDRVALLQNRCVITKVKGQTHTQADCWVIDEKTAVDDEALLIKVSKLLYLKPKWEHFLILNHIEEMLDWIWLYTSHY